MNLSGCISRHPAPSGAIGLVGRRGGTVPLKVQSRFAP